MRATRLDDAAAGDLLQTVWLSLVRHSDTIAEPDAVLQWLVVSTEREPCVSRACRTGRGPRTWRRRGRTRAGTRLEARSDEDGRFVLESVPKGLARFALHPGGRTVLSPTIEL